MSDDTGCDAMEDSDGPSSDELALQAIIDGLHSAVRIAITRLEEADDAPGANAVRLLIAGAFARADRT